MEELSIKVDGKEYNVRVDEKSNGKLNIHCDGEVYEVETKEKILEDIKKELGKKGASKGEAGNVLAPMPGVVFSIDIKKGKKVKKGDRLLTLMAMKMENEINSPKDGMIKEIKVKKNQSVDKGDILVIIK